tara:strand:- start:7741 stop:8460 length:720 start_codon:yes stop_codon:yes gene_type:complete
MANFNFNVVDAASFTVNQHSVIETDCATQYIYKVTSVIGNSIKFSLVGSTAYPETWSSQSYTVDEVEYFDWTSVNEKTITFSKDLYIKFALENSGDPGRFNKCEIFINDDTSGNSYQDPVLRSNDSNPCDNPDGKGKKFDELTDTPINKTGKSLQIVRVNLAETELEYVDAGSLGSDLNYTHPFTSSASVVINHNLGKIPIERIINAQGNIIHGDITYTDLNNLTITFNTAFSGTVYLN